MKEGEQEWKAYGCRYKVFSDDILIVDGVLAHELHRVIFKLSDIDADVCKEVYEDLKLCLYDLQLHCTPFQNAYDFGLTQH